MERYETAARVARPRWKRERGKRERRERLSIGESGGIREYIVALISIGILGCKSNSIAMDGIEKWGVFERG